MSSLYQIEKLNEINYSSWKIQMKSILIHSELWKYVTGEIVKKEDADEKEKTAWENKDQKALSTIILCISASQINYIKHCKTSAEAWLILQGIHQPRGPAQKVTLFKSLLSSRLVEGQSMVEHINNFCEIIDKLQTVDINIPEELLVIILLSSLPSSYENFIIAMESRDSLPALQNLVIKLKEEEQRRKNNGIIETGSSIASEQAFTVNNRKKIRKVNSEKIYNNKDKSNKRCFKCGKLGHFARDCNVKANKDSVSNFTILMKMCGNNINENSWCLDSGATTHMCCVRNRFSSFEECQEKIEVAGRKHIIATGKGKVILQTKTEKIILHNVLYVPDLQGNFLSVSKITINHTIYFNKNLALIKNKQGKTILVAKRINNLYTYQEKYCAENLFIAEGDKQDFLKWHRRYGHLNFNSLMQLSKSNMVKGMKLESIPQNLQCITCMKCKINVQPFPKKAEYRSKKVLELVHTDVCGPMKTKSLGGSKYFVLFIDDMSRKMFVYFIKTKDEVLNIFKKFKTMVENETNRKIKAIRSDNGREYINSEFEKYLEESGIKRQLTTSYTPQQNGVAERANRTIVEMARSMLVDSESPEYLWAEAVNTAVYLRNRSPTKALNNKTPQELWLKKKPNVSHLKIFGSKAVVLEKGSKKSKFQAKGKEYILVGYANKSKAYRLYDKQTKRVIISRDVLYIENINRSSNEDEENVDEEKIPELVMIDTERNDAETNEIDKEKNNERNNEDQSKSTSQRGRGRPKLIKTGRRGRPIKQYHTLNTMNVIEPSTVSEALSSPEANKWYSAMKKEYSSLLENDTWELVQLPKNHKPIGCRWVFAVKKNENGEIERYKARLVAKGCSQSFGINYTKTFSPVLRYTTIRTILALAAEYELLLHQMDVSAAYLNGNLEDEIYMTQPEKFIDAEKPNHVLKLKKSLYGLKQSGRVWNETLDLILKEMGFIRCDTDPCVYKMVEQNEINIIAVYVDDLLIACSTPERLEWIKSKIRAKLNVVDKGRISHFLGLEISRHGDRGPIYISSKQNISNLLRQFKMEDGKTRTTPMEASLAGKCEKDDCEKIDQNIYQSLIGSLIYLSTTTRPDITFSASKLSQFNKSPCQHHWIAAKQVLKYLKGTINKNLIFKRTGKPLEGYVDADWASDTLDRKSYSGFAFILADCAISWESRKQTTVALSSTEAEYVALSNASKEAVYLKRLLKEIGFEEFDSEPTVIRCDNMSAIRIAENPMHHPRTKHIDIKIHFVRQILQQGKIQLQHIATEHMAADVLTKCLNKNKHNKFIERFGLK